MLDRQQRLDALERRCDELDLALARALTRIGNLEVRANEMPTIPAPASECGRCLMSACVCFMLPDVTTEEGGP